MRRYRKRITFSINGVTTALDLVLKKVVPDVRVPLPNDLALDFVYALGEVVEVGEDKWRQLGLAVSKSVASYVAEQLYDPALFYTAWKTGQLHPRFGALAAERITLRLF